MSFKSLVFCIGLILLAGVSGFLHREIYGLQHLGHKQWIAEVTYLIAMPLAKLVILLPGLLVGHLHRQIRLAIVFPVAILAYFPYQYFAGGTLDSGMITLAAHSMAYAVAMSVAYLAGGRF